MMRSTLCYIFYFGLCRTPVPLTHQPLSLLGRHALYTSCLAHFAPIRKVAFPRVLECSHTFYCLLYTTVSFHNTLHDSLWVLHPPVWCCVPTAHCCTSHIGMLLSRFFRMLPVDSIALYLVYKPLYADHKSSDLVSLCRTRTINPFQDSLECGTQRVTQST
jgi:hypothetical protein